MDNSNSDQLVSYPSTSSSTIIKICLCGHNRDDHDRRWEAHSVIFSDYYPCKNCQCNSFSIDEATHRKISKLANEQWQRLLEQNQRQTVMISDNDCLLRKVTI